MSLHTLIIQTYTWTPALETSGEIAITRAQENRTGFCFLEVPNPDDRPRFGILETTGLWRRSRKVARLASALAHSAVEVLEMPLLDAFTLGRVSDFVDSAPRTLAELRTYRYGDARLGAGVVASLVYVTRNSMADPDRHPDLVRQYLRGSALSYELTRALVARHRPELVITYNGRLASALAVAEAASVGGVRVEYQESGSTIDKYEVFPERSQPQAIQRRIRHYWELAGPGREAAAEEYFRRKRSGENSQWYSFVDQQRAGELPPMSAGQRQIVYFCSTDYETELVGRDTTNDMFATQRAGVEHLVRWALAHPECALTIRVHPHSRNVHPSNLEWLRRIHGANVQVLAPDSPVDSYTLMERADVVVTWGSTIGVEAAYAGRPSVVITETAYDGFGCVYEPMTTDALDALLADELLPALPRKAALPAGYWLGEYGARYRYYQPTSFHRGLFLGRELFYDPDWAERTGILRAARAAWHWMRGGRGVSG